MKYSYLALLAFVLAACASHGARTISSTTADDGNEENASVTICGPLSNDHGTFSINDGDKHPDIADDALSTEQRAILTKCANPSHKVCVTGSVGAAAGEDRNIMDDITKIDSSKCK